MNQHMKKPLKWEPITKADLWLAAIVLSALALVVGKLGKVY